MVLIEDLDLIVREDNGKCKVGTTNGNVTILGNNGEKSGWCRIAIHCKICEKDPELFNKGIFFTSRENAVKLKGCGCSGKLPAAKTLIKAKRVMKQEGYEFRGLILGEDDKLTNNTKLKLTCPKGHRYDSTTLSKFINSNRRCPHCAKNVLIKVEEFAWLGLKNHDYRYTYPMITKKVNGKNKHAVRCPIHGVWWTDSNHHLNRSQGCPHPECCWQKISEVKADTQENFLFKANKVHSDSYDYTKTVYKRSFTEVIITCKRCEKDFTQVAGCHLSGNGCPSCAGKNQKQVYIFAVKDGNKVVGLKSGIAINYKSRLSRQRLYSVFDVEVLKVFRFENSDDCKAAEKTCINTLSSGFLTKEQYTDGFRETYPCDDLDKLVEVIKKYKGEEIEL